MDSRLIPVVGGLLTLGLLLIGVDHHVHNRTHSERRADWIKFRTFVLVIVSLLIISRLGWLAAAAVVALISILGTFELQQNLKPRTRPVVGFCFLLLIVLALGHLLIRVSEDWSAYFSLVVLLVATTDAFSQLHGRLLGRHRFLRRLSPNKTLEGLLGGILTATSLACLLGFLLPESRTSQRLTLGVITSVAAIAGDLLFSGMKRSLGIKDFSTILPGNGGILDRFDSLILAAPVFHWSRTLLLS